MTSRLPVTSDNHPAELTNLLPDFLHDALVLSHRFASTEEGKEAVRCGEFTRYWWVSQCTYTFTGSKLWFLKGFMYFAQPRFSNL